MSNHGTLVIMTAAECIIYIPSTARANSSSSMNWPFLFGWWFGTWILFFNILWIIIPTDLHFFQRDWNHQPVVHWHNLIPVFIPVFAHYSKMTWDPSRWLDILSGSRGYCSIHSSVGKSQLSCKTDKTGPGRPHQASCWGIMRRELCLRRWKRRASSSLSSESGSVILGPTFSGHFWLSVKPRKYWTYTCSEKGRWHLKNW